MDILRNMTTELFKVMLNNRNIDLTNLTNIIMNYVGNIERNTNINYGIKWNEQYLAEINILDSLLSRLNRQVVSNSHSFLDNHNIIFIDFDFFRNNFSKLMEQFGNRIRLSFQIVHENNIHYIAIYKHN